MASCSLVCGLILLLLTNLVLIVAFVSPYWAVNENNDHQGLWAFCNGDHGCFWVFQDGYKNKEKIITIDNGWFVATLGLSSVGVGLALMSFIMATVDLCCECRSCNASHAIGGLLLLTFLNLGVATAVFGICGHRFSELGVGTHKSFGWCFWMNLGGAGLSLLTGFCYVIAGRERYY
ncbi:uncharacterized protein LOC131940275 [Physella acuta]|uniref:uncharacterized protein LOC131940275 n=1 Tax=Physella acuta TaxID=109671 RepID=UPI0027DBCDD4|nr:uncharacterized protein LOC131940275 [Physella acuta]